jgi:hypothetical protein
MYTITKQQFNDKHKDLKGVWSSDFQHGTNYDGLKTLLHWENGTCLIIENIHFIIVENENLNLNPIK